MDFSVGYKQAAKSLVGQKLVVGNREAEIVSAKGYSRKENEDPLYAPILDLEPGQVYCPRFRGAILLLIACNDGVSRGGCILVKEVRIGDEIHKGPGRVTAALGITEHGTTGAIKASRDKLCLKM